MKTLRARQTYGSLLFASLIPFLATACDSSDDTDKQQDEDSDASQPSDESSDGEEGEAGKSEASGDGVEDDGEAEEDPDGSPSPSPDVDSDEDGLSDAEEAELGTDPNKVDTDEDGYWDSWEEAEGSDPLNADDRIYEGNWPYNPNKDELEAGAPGNFHKTIGSPLLRTQLEDQFGEKVDLYDFSGAVPIALDLSTSWCSPCKSIASYLSGQGDPDGWGQQIPSLPQKIHDGVIRWITVLGEGLNTGTGANLSDAQAWAAAYPDDKVPVFFSQNFAYAYSYNGWPTFIALNPDMTIAHYPTGNDRERALFILEEYEAPATESE